MSRINHSRVNARERGHESRIANGDTLQHRRDCVHPRRCRPTRPVPVGRETVESFLNRGGRIHRP